MPSRAPGDDRPSPQGYYRWPALHGDVLVFVCEDDLWRCDVAGGVATRITDAPGPVLAPLVSRDGTRVAFTVQQDACQEIYVVSTRGGPVTQVTHAGAERTRVACWSADDTRLFFASSAGQSFVDADELWCVDIGGGDDDDGERGTSRRGRIVEPRRCGFGPVHDACVRPSGGDSPGGDASSGAPLLVARNSEDTAAAHWKGYRGGCGGSLWLDPRGDGRRFVRLDVSLEGAGVSDGASGVNVGSVAWAVDGRITLVGDDGGGRSNLYSFDAADAVARAHASPDAAAAPSASSVKVAYVSGGRLFTSVLGDGPTGSWGPVVGTEVLVEWRGSRAGRERRAVDAEDYVDGWSIHPEGLTMLANVRGRMFSMGLWDGPALEYEPPRCRLGRYLWDGRRVAMVTDASGEDDVEIHSEDGDFRKRRLCIPPAVLGRVDEMVSSPESPLIAVVNHRARLLIIDAETGKVRTADFSDEAGGVGDLAWSPCGNWLAYTRYDDPERSRVRILDARSGEVRDATAPVLGDCAPSWDPSGNFLYFLSARELEPMYDSGRFGLSFHGIHRPHAIALRADVPNPLLRELRPPHDSESSSGGSDYEDTESDTDDDDDYDTDDTDADAPEPIEIDFDGISGRIVALPMPAGRYGSLTALDDGKFMVIRYPARRGGRVGLDAPYYDSDASDSDTDDEGGGGGGSGGALLRFDVRQLKTCVLIDDGVRSVELSMDRRSMLVEKRDDYGCVDDGEDVDDTAPNRRSGLIDIDGRLDVVVDPGAEWAQMLGETWRRLRDEWWHPGMRFGDDSGVCDWPHVLQRYTKVLPRVTSRHELADMMRDMVAELRSSHVSVYTGDVGEHRRRRAHSPGHLGADFTWDPSVRGYVVAKIVEGDVWDEHTGGALRKPGVNVAVGDVLTHVNRVRLTSEVGPSVALVGKGGAEVLLTFTAGDGPRRPLGASMEFGAGGALAQRIAALDARYRDAIRDRTKRVDVLGKGLVGYLRLPDMERTGYSEFWRHFPHEVRKGALVVDLRGNLGGHISELLLAKLAQRPLAWDVPRRGSPTVYPSHASGAVVALVDENTGSDAELAAEAFRRLGLGRVVGARTWGGLLTTSDSFKLVDGSEVSMPQQAVAMPPAGGVDSGRHPEIANGIENRGVVPDVEVANAPHDYATDADPQLDAAVREALALLAANPPARFDNTSRTTDEDEARAAAAERAHVGPGGSRWPFKTYAPYPEDGDEEEEEVHERFPERERRKKLPKGAKGKR
ncbi:predicted protein [Micromonas commoda]|uniref:Tail specific protease domain-containing protein n=1 Tax=Micromonas commoda (strain RCC299 / NOUM17 / CCMP2709) TaxID=296587 RepID=C1ED24_MICCC|nr:predicted protein [Micromonas commoda]ACO65681.1 predicted protein [Micromonas commoda]|eukprot:XP_002504423.1 predicted protein [Micromonas commoda]